MRKPLVDVLQRRVPERVPFWLMRQAGRYLPEYRQRREVAKSFLDLVYDPDLASDITMQPLRRFRMDAAILFSDILVIPHALGQEVIFTAGEGPKLDPLRSEADFAKLKVGGIERKLGPVVRTVEYTRYKMEQEFFTDAALIGFCGSPWTVICYMIEGRGSKDFEAARHWALRDPTSFQKLVDIVTEASCLYLSSQIRAGAEVVQLFDSWSGVLDPDEFRRWVIEPTKIIRTYLRDKHPQIPVIGFPRGAGVMSVPYAKETGVDAIGLDQMVDPFWAGHNLQDILPVQGNLDPVRLLVGGEALEHGLEKIRRAFTGRPFIFNLGHGVIKETKVEHVEHLINIVRGWSV